MGLISEGKSIHKRRCGIPAKNQKILWFQMVFWSSVFGVSFASKKMWPLLSEGDKEVKIWVCGRLTKRKYTSILVLLQCGTSRQKMCNQARPSRNGDGGFNKGESWKETEHGNLQFLFETPWWRRSNWNFAGEKEKPTTNKQEIYYEMGKVSCG